ncbi:MAG: AAA+ family ATPase, partial [Armatimonadota bacterium]
SIEDERDRLNLDAFQANQASTRRSQADETVQQRIPETYQWLLVPVQETPQGPVEWREIKLQGTDALAVRAGKKLINDELLTPEMAGTRLRLELDRIPLWRGDDVSLQVLSEDFAQYLYLSRLKAPYVLTEAVQDGVSRLTWEEAFAFADSKDEASGRYVGLVTGTFTVVTMERGGLVVRADAARRQQDTEMPTAGEGQTPVRGDETPGATPGAGTARGVIPQPAPAAPVGLKRFHRSVELEAARVPRDAGRVAEEVIQHLVGIVGAKVKVTIEITAEIPDGAPDHVVRTVTENCRTLKFRGGGGFEEE